MEYVPCRERTFPFELPIFYVNTFRGYLRWFKHLVERFGRKAALDVWSRTVDLFDDRGILGTLGGDWYSIANDESFDLEVQLEAAMDEYYPVSVQGIQPEDAHDIVERTPPIVQIRDKFRIVMTGKRITAYQALQLRFDWTASLAERLMDRFGKEGELAVYDLVSEGRLIACADERGSASDFIKGFIAKPDPETLFGAALESQVIHVAQAEAILHITECEWARFFRDHHPRVGYLMACSTDEMAYRNYNPALRLQRTSTLMEGGRVCDFRVYTTE